MKKIIIPIIMAIFMVGAALAVTVNLNSEDTEKRMTFENQDVFVGLHDIVLSGKLFDLNQDRFVAGANVSVYCSNGNDTRVLDSAISEKHGVFKLTFEKSLACSKEESIGFMAELGSVRYAREYSEKSFRDFKASSSKGPESVASVPEFSLTTLAVITLISGLAIVLIRKE